MLTLFLFLVVIVCYSICPLILLAIRQLLVRENSRRDAAALAAKADGKEDELELVDVHHADGTTTVEKVRQNFGGLRQRNSQLLAIPG